VQRRFGVRAESTMGIHIRASSNQAGHDVRTVGEMPRPVGCRMQQRPVARLIANPGFCEPRVRSEQPLEPRDIAGTYGSRGSDRTRIIS
jgi:hypothetical protein